MYGHFKRIDLIELIASLDFDHHIVPVFLRDQVDMTTQVIDLFRKNTRSGGYRDAITLGLVLFHDPFECLVFSHGFTSQDFRDWEPVPRECAGILRRGRRPAIAPEFDVEFGRNRRCSSF